MHHANQATTIHRRPSTTKQSSHPSTFVKPPDFGGHSNVATDRIADAMRYAPAVDYWLRPVLDDGGCQDWTVPSCKWCQAYVPIKSTPSLGGGDRNHPSNTWFVESAPKSDQDRYIRLCAAHRVHNRQTDTWTTIRCDSCSNEPHLTGVKLSFLFIDYNLNYATLLVNNK